MSTLFFRDGISGDGMIHCVMIDNIIVHEIVKYWAGKYPSLSTGVFVIYILFTGRRTRPGGPYRAKLCPWS